MNRLLASALVLTIASAAPAAFAGGPVIVEEGNPEVIAEAPASSIGILPLLLIPLILCIALCGSDDEGEPVKRL